MKLELEQTAAILEARRGERTLFRYDFAPQMPQLESPRPFLHPLRTLKGNLVTAFRPHDHLWHKGVSLTCAELSGENFWGGVTWVQGQGYKQLPNNGTQRHLKWKRVQATEEGADLIEDVRWEKQDGTPWIAEERRLEIDTAQAAAGWWSLKWSSHLHNISNQPLVWGSPTTRGRENAGYGGLFWRGPRDFQGGQLLISENREGEKTMGQRSPWLAYIGAHDESADRTTMLFLDDAQNPRFPTQWFVRNSVTMVAFAWMFDREYMQPPDEILHIAHRIVIADGTWNREKIEKFVASQKTA
ncbi:MAG: hypothetical protein JWN98_1262 [Abditibacteriota bacterium]|nr:hypothetical protein [Abditibacteriota bacterium]